MYLGAALIASITLGTVAGLAGLLTLGSVLVLCLNWTALEEPAYDRLMVRLESWSRPALKPTKTGTGAPAATGGTAERGGRHPGPKAYSSVTEGSYHG